MAGIAIIAATLMAGQGLVSDRVDVAYEQLADGNNAAAIAEIQGNEALDRDDPARLINLGAAYTELGRIEDARLMYEAAMQSRQRYDLETADGQWVDSRELARIALARLDNVRFDAPRMATAE